MITDRNRDEVTRQRSICLWPGVVILFLQWLIWLFLPVVVPEALEISAFSGFIGWLAIVVWWVFFSRASRFERWFAVALMIIMNIVTFFLLHESISTAMMGMMFPMYVTPIVSLAFVIWALFYQYFPEKIRQISMSLSIIISCVAWVFLRTDGMTGDAHQDINWRWAESLEETLLDNADNDPLVNPMTFQPDTARILWSGFRGFDRNSVIHNVSITVDWTVSPPTEMWRRPIGPGISSFAVKGRLIYTQEQRGDKEMVTCYDIKTGRPVWRHHDAGRFWDSHAGAGPRGTPTVFGDRVYSLGPTGILNALNALDGSVVWSRNAASDTDVKIPEWGVSSSPLVVDSVVIVATVGKLAAYDVNSGKSLWIGPDGGDSYSSPHLVTIDDVQQVLLMSGKGVISVTARDGTQLWNYKWPPGTRIVQPGITENGDLLIGGGELNGLRRLSIERSADRWEIEEQWESKKLKPYYNDFVVHKDHAFGFNGSRIVCIDLKNGERKWTGGRYGHGQLVLLAEQDALIIVSEQGELVLAKATPEEFNEIFRFQAIEGKTWNHPVLVDDVLLVRNSQEMAAFRLPVVKG